MQPGHVQVRAMVPAALQLPATRVCAASSWRLWARHAGKSDELPATGRTPASLEPVDASHTGKTDGEAVRASVGAALTVPKQIDQALHNSTAKVERPNLSGLSIGTASPASAM